MSKINLSQFHQTFFDEAAEHARTLEEHLLSLEAAPNDTELHNALFRAAHSIKGASGILGFETITSLTHAMESVLEAVRSLAVRVDGALSSLLLEATDLLSAALVTTREGTPAPDIRSVVERLERVEGHASAPAPAPAPAPAQEAVAPASSPSSIATRAHRWHITFRPGERVFANGLDPAFALKDLAALGTTRVDALLEQVPPFAEFDPEASYLGWKITLETAAPKHEIDDVFLFMDDARELKIVEDGLPVLVAAPAFVPIANPTPVAASPAPAAEAVAKPDTTSTAPKKPVDSSTLRVSTEKVDSLINLVGELVIAQAMISRSLASFTPSELPRLREATAEMERHTRELQGRVMNIRMVPIGTIFNRFRRLVRDIGDQLGKDIDLQIAGEDTELDKSMVEALADPLTHLVRNAADHGLERTEARVAAGKRAAGTLRLAARHQGGNIIIEISDDGGGLDEPRILKRAIERGLVPPGAKLTPEEIHQLIFAPGFSTAEAVTNLSGRGVGMDVVRRSVEQLNGEISISTTKGQGTRFRITLPLTLAILDGMALRIGNSTFVIPLSQVVETLRLKDVPVTRLPGQGEVLRVRGHTTAFLRPSEVLSVSCDTGPLAVVCEAGETRFALCIDELLGKSQFVIKSLEPNFKKLEGLLGATILGDGAVSFILDVLGLARLGHLTRGDDVSASELPSPEAPEVRA
jgi:two-component system chemotaxis sensor kinase CheA